MNFVEVGQEIMYIMFGFRWVAVKTFLITLVMVALYGMYGAAWSGMSRTLTAFYVIAWEILWCIAWFLGRSFYLICFRW